MVLFVLYVKADLENVETLTAPALHRWCLDVKSHVATRSARPLPGANKPSQLTVVRDVKKLTREISAADSGEFVPFVGFECRGLEPYAWHPESGYRVISAGRHAAFDDVDLSDDWADYDEEGEQSVGVYSVEWKFEVHK
ncbi:CXXC motif containing zinc binding protein [Phytophthora ramorum]|uniref:CXXC motif containing zinc binding protein n=1 Tax=Phytophthora ramorum TaxID=164328 RepID=UPI0030AB250C|nr:CXXC motif containing zinc binding protein [Phytophthora ramorum]